MFLRRMNISAGIAIAVLGSCLLSSCSQAPEGVSGDAEVTSAHEVSPGELDDYYGFWSGGHSGEVRVMGVPSMRLFKRIPVFNYDSGSGWGITNESQAMLKGTYVGDTHHFHGSYKDGTYDGRYFWINDKANNRLARIRGDLLEVDAMIDIPHTQGTHGLFPQRYPQTEWVILNSEFRTPLVNTGK